MSITITEEQFMAAVSAAQDVWDEAGSETGKYDVATSLMMRLQNLAFSALIQHELFKDETEED